MISHIVDSKRERICGDTYLLTKQEIKEFHENGYVKLEGVVTENELKSLWQLYDQLVFMDYPRVPKMNQCSMKMMMRNKEFIELMMMI